MSDAQLVTYESTEQVATITMDDGKANAMSPAMSAAIDAALDRAEAAGLVVVLRGRDGVFSAGYDLKVFQRGDPAEMLSMLRAGGHLAARLMDFPRPVIAACTGHGIAQGAFLLMACDVRIATDGDALFGMNESATGMVVPRYAVAACRHRMSPAALDQALVTARLVDPHTAQRWGIVDDVVPVGTLDAAVTAEADRLAALVPDAHLGNKRRVRDGLAARMHQLVDEEYPADRTS